MKDLYAFDAVSSSNKLCMPATTPEAQEKVDTITGYDTSQALSTSHLNMSTPTVTPIFA